MSPSTQREIARPSHGAGVGLPHSRVISTPVTDAALEALPSGEVDDHISSTLRGLATAAAARRGGWRRGGCVDALDYVRSCAGFRC